jgi:hypothetical protein
VLEECKTEFFLQNVISKSVTDQTVVGGDLIKFQSVN